MPRSIRRPAARIEIDGAARRGDASRSSCATRARASPPRTLERIFDKFYRAHDGDRRRAGTGLGLAIAKGFVEAQGGTHRGRATAADRSGAEFIVS